jgi:hypothetical protein
MDVDLFLKLVFSCVVCFDSRNGKQNRHTDTRVNDGTRGIIGSTALKRRHERARE